MENKIGAYIAIRNIVLYLADHKAIFTIVGGWDEYGPKFWFTPTTVFGIDTDDDTPVFNIPVASHIIEFIEDQIVKKAGCIIRWNDEKNTFWIKWANVEDD